MCDKEKKQCSKCCGKGSCHKDFKEAAGEKPALPEILKKPLKPVIPPLPKKPDQN